MVIWQDLVSQASSASGYQSLKRFIRRLWGTPTLEAHPVIVIALGKKAQVTVDIGTVLQMTKTAIVAMRVATVVSNTFAPRPSLPKLICGAPELPSPRIPWDDVQGLIHRMTHALVLVFQFHTWTDPPAETVTQSIMLIAFVEGFLFIR